MEELFENIELPHSNLSAVNLIKDLHENKGGEHISVELVLVLGAFVSVPFGPTFRIFYIFLCRAAWLTESGGDKVLHGTKTANKWTENVKEHNDNPVPKGNAKDLSPNDWGKHSGIGH